MARTPPTGPRIDPDGVRTFRDEQTNRRMRLALGAVAVAIVLSCGALLLHPTQLPQAQHEPLETTGSSAASTKPSEPGATRQAPVVRRIRAVHIDQIAPAAVVPPPESQSDEPQPEVSANDLIAALKAAGETEGIAAFPPPGTDPIKSGIVVPEDFQLPEGYVRHYQATDEGERLEAILMFSPDYEFFDDAGERIALPEDRIVPREMAPAGLPIRMLEPPSSPGAQERDR
jgi:hypothetical protein